MNTNLKLRITINNGGGYSQYPISTLTGPKLSDAVTHGWTTEHE